MVLAQPSPLGELIVMMVSCPTRHKAVTTTSTRRLDFVFTSRNWDRAATPIFEYIKVHREVQKQLKRRHRVNKVQNMANCKEIRLKGALSSRSDLQCSVYVLQLVEIPMQSRINTSNIRPKVNPINSYDREPPRQWPVMQGPVRSKKIKMTKKNDVCAASVGSNAPGHSTALCSWPSYTATRSLRNSVPANKVTQGRSGGNGCG